MMRRSRFVVLLSSLRARSRKLENGGVPLLDPPGAPACARKDGRHHDDAARPGAVATPARLPQFVCPPATEHLNEQYTVWYKPLELGFFNEG